MDLSHPALQHPILDLPRQSLHGAPQQPVSPDRSSLLRGAGFLIGHPIPTLGVYAIDAKPSKRQSQGATSGRKVEVLFAVLIEAVPMIAAWTKDSVKASENPITAVMIRNISSKFVIPPHIDECLTL